MTGSDGYVWSDRWSAEAAEHLQRYFGGFAGLTEAFPCMRDDYPWGAHRPDVPDSRVPAQNNTEYHGLESHAAQYRAVAMYEEAAHHWLMAAWHRHADKEARGFSDGAHDRAIGFCLRNVAFDEALRDWSSGGGSGPAPEPGAFGLTEAQVGRNETEAEAVLDGAHARGLGGRHAT